MVALCEVNPSSGELLEWFVKEAGRVNPLVGVVK